MAVSGQQGEGGGTFRGGGELVNVAGARSNVRFNPGSSIRRTFNQGDEIPTIQFPRTATGGVGSIEYRWIRSPSSAELRRAGVRQFGGNNPRINGSNVQANGSRNRVLRWTWEARDPEPSDNPIQVRDTITVTITILAPDPLLLATTQTPTLSAGQRNFTQRLNGASGGSGNYTYNLVRYRSGARSLSSLGLVFNRSTNTLSTRTNGAVSRLAGLHTFNHSVSDGVSTVRRTFRIRVTIPITVTPLNINHGPISLTWAVGERSTYYFARRARGGIPPYRYELNLLFGGDSSAFDGSDARVTGLPTRTGTYTGSYTVYDSTGESSSASITIRVVGLQAPLRPSIIIQNVKATTADVWIIRNPRGVRPTSYQKRHNTGSVSSGAWASTALYTTITGLTPNTQYVVGARALNGAIASSIATAKFTTAQSSLIPLRMNHGDYSVEWTVGDRGRTLYFAKMASGGTPPYRYVLTMSFTEVSDSRAFNIDGTRGTGAFRNQYANPSRIVGNPTKVGTYTGIFTVWDANNNSVPVGVRINVVAPTAPSSPNININDIGQTTVNFQITPGPGATPTSFQYRLGTSGSWTSSSTIASGITHYSVGVYTLSPSTRYTIQARALNGSVASTIESTTFTTDARTFPRLDINFAGFVGNNEIDWVVGEGQTVNLPQRATGGSGPGTYEYSPAISFGDDAANFSVDARGRWIQGNPSRVGRYTGSLVVRDQTQPIPQSDSYQIVINAISSLRFSGDCAFGPFTPGEDVGQLSMPTLLNRPTARRGDSEGISAADSVALQAAGLSIVDGQLTGTVNTELTRSQLDNGIPFTWTVTVAGHGTYDASCRVTFRLSRLSIPQQDSLTFNEQTSISPTRLVSASGGSGQYTYSLGNNFGLGVQLRSSLDNVLVGTTTEVAADVTRQLTLTARDSATGQSVSTRFNITIKDVAPTDIYLAPYTYEAGDNKTASQVLPLATGSDAATATYAATRQSGVPVSTVSITSDGLTLNVAATTSDDLRSAVWERTAMAGGTTVSANVVVQIYGRFRFESVRKVLPTVELRAQLPEGWPNERVAPVGGKLLAGQPRSYAVQTQFPDGSGLTLAVGQNGRLTITGAPLTASAEAIVRATDYPKTDGSFDTADLTVVVSASTSPFCFPAAAYTITTEEGGVVDWPIPQPTGGTVDKIEVGTPIDGFTKEITSSLEQPIEDEGTWYIRGNITARSGSEQYTMRATAENGAICDAELTIVIGARTTIESFRTACGIVIATRIPKTDVLERSLRSTLPDFATGIGPIEHFRPSKLIAEPGEFVTFDWRVAARYNRVQIAEVDLWLTDPELPLCAGAVNLQPRLSVGHTGTAAMEWQVPERPGVYEYRLDALRAGSSSKYLPADYWICRILVTSDSVARHISLNRDAVPEEYPVIAQIEYRGESPTGDQLLTLTGQFDETAQGLPDPQTPRNTGGVVTPTNGTGDDDDNEIDDEYCKQNPDDPACNGGNGGTGVG